VDLGDRVKHVRQLRGLGSAELDRLAGAAIGTTSRLESKQRGKFGGTATTVARVAKALGVSMQWLMTGQGPMEETEQDPIPNRALAASIAREGGIEEAAIQAVLALPVKDPESRTVLWWINAFQTREAFHRQERELMPNDTTSPRRAQKEAGAKPRRPKTNP
jgi:transcriptional regulator with XRE-family HTH domain